MAEWRTRRSGAPGGEGEILGLGGDCGVRGVRFPGP